MTEELLLQFQKYGYNEIPSLDYMLSRLEQYGYYADIVTISPNTYKCVLNQFVDTSKPIKTTFIGDSRKEAVAKAFLWAMEENCKSWKRVLELGAKLGDRLKEAGITEEQIKEDVKRIRKEIREKKEKAMKDFIGCLKLNAPEEIRSMPYDILLEERGRNKNKE
jgi:hypothetical protein